MKKFSKKLEAFITKKEIVDTSVFLGAKDRGIFRSLKSEGERAIKGRVIDSCVFSVRERGGIVSLVMILEGRHSMSVGRQVSRRFKDRNELKFADVVKTKRGAKVVLCSEEGE